MLDTELIPAREKNSRRLMVVLHGLGDSMDGYRWLPDELRLPWMNYLLVNAPDTYYSGFAWYDFTGNAGLGVGRSRELLFELLDKQRAAGFPTEETVVFGFSQGCLMAMEVGARYPHKLAGIVGISGYVHESDVMLKELSLVAKEQRFLITHGMQDPLIPFNEVKAQFHELKAAGLPIEWHEFAKAHTIAGEAELGVIREFVKESFGKAAK